MKRLYSFACADAQEVKALVRRLEALDGVGFVRANGKDGRLSLRFDPAEVEEEEILSAAGTELTRLPRPTHAARKRLFPVWLLTLAVVYISLAQKISWWLPGLLQGSGGNIAQLLMLIPLWILCIDTVRLSVQRKHLPAALAAGLCTVYSAVALMYAVQGRELILLFDSAALLPALLCSIMRLTALRRKGIEKEYSGLLSSDFPALRRANKLSNLFIVFAILASLAAALVEFLSSGAADRAVLCCVCVLVSASPDVPILFTRSIYAGGKTLLEKAGARVEKPENMQLFAAADTVVLTAEGLLTGGECSLVSAETAPDTQENILLALAASALQDKDTPEARALIQAAESRNIPLDPLLRTETDPEGGVRALIGETRVLVGSFGFMRKNAMDLGPWEEKQPEREGTCLDLYVATAGKIRGILHLSVNLSSSAREALGCLKKAKIDAVVLPRGAVGVPFEAVSEAGAKIIHDESIEMSLRLFRADKRHMLYLYAGQTCPTVFEGAVPRLSLGGDKTAEIDGNGLDFAGAARAICTARRIRRAARVWRHIWEIYSLATLVLSFFAPRLHIFPAQFMLVNFAIGLLAMVARPHRAKIRL